MMNITPVVKQLLIINIIFFIGSQIVPLAESYFALYYFENPMFKFWQPLTHMFMHGGIAHIFFNMFALYSFGSALEHFWGGNKFLFFYISCGLGAALLHSFINYLEFRNELSYLLDSGFKKEDVLSLLNQNMFDRRWLDIIGQDGVDVLSISYHTPAVGASGAVYGLLVAFAFMFPNAELALMFIPIPIKAKYFVPGILAIDLFLGFKGSSIFGAGSTGIAHFAHIGGALTGFIMMWYWKKNQFNHKRWN
ncbi:rhomboid family intramembrane serine protease [Flavobacterium sp.]|jgi:membrane associated rhomboid family serine protease|uniref:rhomboid family intramembrane serine protease n=1 Tax=Flavobacterium sp. TaxID=239 RepID=UPI0037BFAA50